MSIIRYWPPVLSLSPPDMLADAGARLLAEGGPAALTVRGLARECRASPSWLMDRFTNRRRMRMIVTAQLAQRHMTWVDQRLARDGLAALLPQTDDEVIATRVWLAAVELGRTEQEVAYQVDRVRDHERGLISQLGRHSMTDLTVETLLALTRGLRESVSSLEHPLRPATARAALTAHARHVMPELPDDILDDILRFRHRLGGARGSRPAA